MTLRDAINCVAKHPGMEELLNEARLLKAEVDRLQDEVAALRNSESGMIVDLRRELSALECKLPKTADGVIYTPGMPLFKRRKKHPCWCEFVVELRGGHTVEVEGKARRFGHADGWLETVADCYSTREAAEKARLS